PPPPRRRGFDARLAAGGETVRARRGQRLRADARGVGRDRRRRERRGLHGAAPQLTPDAVAKNPLYGVSIAFLEYENSCDRNSRRTGDDGGSVGRQNRNRRTFDAPPKPDTPIR